MTCNCENNKEQDGMDCPAGHSYDVSTGKCVKSEKKEQFGSPGVSQKADDAESDVDSGKEQEVSQFDCPPGHRYDATQEKCVPSSPEVPAVADTKADIAKEARIKQLETQVAELKMKEKNQLHKLALILSLRLLTKLQRISKSLRKIWNLQVHYPTRYS